MMWTLKDLLNAATTTSCFINGKWVPARPINYRHESIKARFRNAWAVFNGKADAVKWPENQ